jgi:integrase
LGAESVKALIEAELVAFLDGLRIGEAIEIRWRDLDLGEGWLAVDRQHDRRRVSSPKSRRRRRIRLGEDVARELRRLRTQTRADDDELVFTADRVVVSSPPCGPHP